MIHSWKRALLEGASGVFERGGAKKPEIGELAVANDPPRGFRGPTRATVLTTMSRKLKPWTGK